MGGHGKTAPIILGGLIPCARCGIGAIIGTRNAFFRSEYLQVDGSQREPKVGFGLRAWGCILAAVLLVWGTVFCLRDNSADDPYLLSVVAIVAFAIWVIGLACRHIFSDR